MSQGPKQVAACAERFDTPLPALWNFPRIATADLAKWGAALDLPPGPG